VRTGEFRVQVAGKSESKTEGEANDDAWEFREVTLKLTAAITPEGDLFVSRCLEVEVASQGRSVEESLRNLQEALELYFEDEPHAETLTNPIIAPMEIRVA
jgi:predicted RNase H-like HicB family nuclease